MTNRSNYATSPHSTNDTSHDHHHHHHLISPDPPPHCVRQPRLTLYEMQSPVIPLTLPAPLPPITFLPSSILDRDTVLLGKLLRHLWSSPGLCHGERLVLGAVFQHMPLIDNVLGNLPDTEIPSAPAELLQLAIHNGPNSDCGYTFYDRILRLPIEQLKLMAKLFTAALASARSWGGTKKSDAGTSTTPTPLSSLGLGDPIIDYDLLFSTLQIQPFPDMAGGADSDQPGNDQPSSQGKGKHTPRPVYQRRACFDRQLQSCAITGGQSNLQHAHIIPHSIVSLSGSDGSTATLFWMALAIILGPSLRDTVFSIVGAGENFYNTTNSIALVSGLHGHLDTGQLHLVPEIGNTAFDPTTTRHLDISVCWLGSLLDLALISTARPLIPEDQVRVQENTSSYAPPMIPTRAVADGDRFRLFTNNPEEQPLPHPLLLGIHTMLWRMIATAGMAETSHAKKRRHVDAVDRSGPKRAKRGGSGMRRARGRRGGSSSRSQGGGNDDGSPDGGDVDQIETNHAGISRAATGDVVDGVPEDYLSYAQHVEHFDSRDNRFATGTNLDPDTRSSKSCSQPFGARNARPPQEGQEPVPLNNLQLAWIGFRLKFGASRQDSIECDSQSGSDSEGTSDCDEEYDSDEYDGEGDEGNDYVQGGNSEEGAQEGEAVQARWRGAITARTGAAWTARMQLAAETNAHVFST